MKKSPRTTSQATARAATVTIDPKPLTADALSCVKGGDDPPPPIYPGGPPIIRD